MPFAVLKSIREISSEDKFHCASNLLKNEPAKKWKTAESGDKSAYVIIEMECEYKIKGIDIGNECSAFVEVLVGGPACARENFKEILITCSFMTPTESRTCSMPNRVRCFGREALVEDTASQKWKLLKIICTQPFNKEIKYGLSFIKVHVEESLKTKDDESSKNEMNKSVMSRTFGNFSLREDSQDSETESTTSLFNRWKVAKNKEPNGVSTVPRIPSPSVLKKPNESFINKKITTNTATPPSKKISGEQPVVHDRNRNSLLFGDDDEPEPSPHDKQKKKLEKLEKIIAADQERVTKEMEKAKKSKKLDTPKNETPKRDKNQSEREKPSKSPKSAKKADEPSTSSNNRRPSSSSCVSDKPKKPKLEKPVQYKSFNQLLSGVVLVISGIQNPDRANLRNKALALGAKYKADWDSSSTHLICAFKNTPKYNQVRGKGKIVTRSWIEDCHSQKRKLPWRRYALDSAELLKPESDDEILDESLNPSQKESEATSRKNSHDSDDVLIAQYDNDEPNHSQVISSGSDTEDEIQKVLTKMSPLKKTSPPSKTKDIFEVSTEEEDYVAERKRQTSDGLRFFQKFKFFIGDELSATTKFKVEQYIETYNGVLTTSMRVADYLIVEERVKNIYGGIKGEQVTPLWILECNDAESLIPTTRYLVK